MAEVKEKFRNVTFNVSESLIEEIDDFCKERGGVQRKQWLYDLMENKNAFKLSSINLRKKIDQMQIDFKDISSDYTKLFMEKERLEAELQQKQKAYSELFTSTLKYRTFYKRLKNLFSKF